MDWLFTPPLAFPMYLLLVGILTGVGRLLAGPAQPNRTKSGTYASGEAPATTEASPGYRRFFVAALFFAILHLGALMVGSSNLSIIAIIYLAGLMVVLAALILG